MFSSDAVRHGARRAGEHAPCSYNVYAIYDNATNSRVIGNTISDFQTDGVSVRFHGAIVSRNYIARGEEGIGFYERDSVAGISRFTDNTIADTTAASIFVRRKRRLPAAR